MASNAFTAKASYDVFLSYNSADHGVVEDIARKLRDEGLEPFLDRWYLAPGARWRSKLEDTLSSCKAVAIFVGPGEMGSWQQREVDVALDLQSKSSNLPVIPVLLPGCEPPLGFLRQLTWVDLRTQTRDLGIVILAKAARGEAPGPDLQKHLDAVRVSICPYRGLLHFREEDASFFFGREAAIDKLMDAMQRQPLVTVVGASGSGKSSVVRAGLVPRLRSDRRTAWETVILVPTDQPLKALARAFVPLLEPTMGEVDRLAEATKLVEHFRSGAISLYDIVERIVEKQAGTNRVLIVVDQFEELYTLTSDEEARRRFLDELLAASSRTGCKANIALTLRGDFVGRALAYRPLSDRLQDAQINLGPMTREELECAIRKPAEKIQLEFEPGLVRRILNDVGDEPGNLPLLEFVLKELWDKRRGSVLLNETYDAIGGLQGAVATKADELLKGLSSAEQKILQRVFLRIVRPSESGLDTRRRAAFTELPPEGADLVVKLANERLLVTNQSASGLEQTVEVAHEALISNWSTLRAWVNEDREFLLWRVRLGALFTEWERAQESDEALLRGPLLIEAQKWFDQRSQDLSDQERKFISASRALRERLAREEKERQGREIEAARKLAEAQKERAEEAEKRAKEQKEAASRLRRLAWILATVALAAIVAGGMAVVGWNSARIAEKAARTALSQSDFLRASELLDQNRALEALAFLARACRTDPDNRYAATRLFSLLSQRNWILPVTEPLSHTNDRGETPALERVRFNTDGTKFVATTWDEGEAQVWETLSGKLLLSGVKCNTTGVDYGSHPCLPDEQSFSSREPLILIAYKDKVQVCNFNPDPGTPASLKHDSEVSVAQFSMDGATILTGCVDGKVTIWDTKSRSRIGEPLVLNGKVGAFSRDGTRAITTDEEQASWMQLWRIDPGAHRAMPVQPTIDGKFLSISEDGRRLCFVTAPPLPLEIHFRDLDSGEEHTKPLANVPASDAEDIEASSFGCDSRHFVAMAIRRSENDLLGEGQFATGQVRVWDGVTGTQLSCMRHETHAVDPSEGFQPYQASLSPDGTRVASVAYEDRSLRIWDSKTGGMANEPIRGSGFDDVTFSPDGRCILTASDTGVAQMWDIQPLVPIREPTVLVTQLKFTEARFSDDAKFLLLTNEEGQQKCFDVKTAQPAPTIPPIFARPKWQNSTGTRRFVNIDPEESGDEGDKRLIDTATGKSLLPEIRVRGGTVRFSSDGKRLLIGRFSESQSELELRSAETGAQLREPIFDCSEGWFSPAGDKVIMNTRRGLAVLDIATGRELIDRIKFFGTIAAATLTSDGVVVATLEGGRPELYHFDFQLNYAPALLTDIAEGVAQQRLNEFSAPEPRCMPLTKLREMAGKLDEREAPGAFVAWARWFLTPRESRPMAPDSQRTLREYIQECIDRGSEESLDEAALLAVGDKELLAKIAVIHAKQ